MIGQTLSHYKILDKLGEGGMGAVYLAEDTKLERRVALKVLPPEVAADREGLKRFHREAKIVAALNHPNIVTLHSVEEADDVHFLTMELVEGETLDALIPAGGLETEKILEITEPLVDALAAAHEQGIIHRDLKPANIMVGADGRAKVLDFGLAKLHSVLPGGSQEATLTALTAQGAIVGTIPYMSPEQVAGKPVDRRTDIFSLGVILYEMCTGQRPFPGESSTHTMSAILRDSPPLVSEIRDDLPESLGRIVHRCLEKEPGKRYETARGVRDELEDMRRQMESGPVESGAAADRLLPVGKWWLALAAAVGALAVIGLLRFSPTAEESREHPGEAPPVAAAAAARQMIVVLPFENLGPPEDEYFAAGMTEEITSRLSGVSGLGVISRKGALRYAGTDKSSLEIGEELGVGYILGGSLRWATGGDGPSRVRITPELIRVADDTQLWSEPYDRVIEDIFEVQSDIAGQVIERLGVTLLEGERTPLSARPTDNPEAYTLYLKGRHFWEKRTSRDIQIGLDYFQQAVELDPTYALAHAGIADVWIFHGWYSLLAPKETFPRAKQAALTAIELDETLAEPHASLAHVHFEFDHDWEAAEREYLRAIELNPRHPTAHHWYSRFLSAMGRHEESRRHAERAQELDPLAAIINTWVALRHYFAREHEAAIEEYRKALQLAPNFVAGHWHLGWAFEQTGRYEEAISEAQKAIALSDGNPLFLASLGHAYAIAGDNEEARKILDRLRQESATRHVSAYHTAVIHGALGDADEALRWLDRALEERSPWIGFMRVDPRLDGLRSDPRIDALLQKARLDF